MRRSLSFAMLFLGLACAPKKQPKNQTIGNLPNTAKIAATLKGTEKGVEIIGEALLLAKERNALKGSAGLSEKEIKAAIKNPNQFGFDLKQPISMAVLNEKNSPLLIQLPINHSGRANLVMGYLLNEMGDKTTEIAHDGRVIKAAKKIAFVEYNDNIWLTFANNSPGRVLKKAIDEAKVKNLSGDNSFAAMSDKLESYPFQVFYREGTKKKSALPNKIPELLDPAVTSKMFEAIFDRLFKVNSFAYGFDINEDSLKTRMLMPLDTKSGLQQLTFTDNADELSDSFPMESLISIRSDIHLGNMLETVFENPKQGAKEAKQILKLMGFNPIEWLKADYAGPLTATLFASKGKLPVGTVIHFKMKDRDALRQNVGLMCKNMKIKSPPKQKAFQHCRIKDITIGAYDGHFVAIYQQDDSKSALRFNLGVQKGLQKGLAESDRDNRLADLNINVDKTIEAILMSNMAVSRLGGLNAAVLATAAKKAIDLEDMYPVAYQLKDGMLISDSEMPMSMMQQSIVAGIAMAIAIPNFIKYTKQLKEKEKAPMR